MTQEEFDSIDEEQLDELSKETLKSYTKKAMVVLAPTVFGGQRPGQATGPGSEEKNKEELALYKKRSSGYDRAISKLYPDPASVKARKEAALVRHKAFVERKAANAAKRAEKSKPAD